MWETPHLAFWFSLLPGRAAQQSHRSRAMTTPFLADQRLLSAVLTPGAAAQLSGTLIHVCPWTSPTRPLGRLTAHTPATARRAGVSPSISAARGPVLSRQPEPGLGDPLGTPSPTHCGLPACLCGGRDPWSPVLECLAPLWCSLWQDHEHRAICCFAHLISLGS